MKTFIQLLFLGLFASTAHSQTSLQGTVTDAENGEPIIFGTVAVYKNNILITGTETDLGGFYSISDLNTGTYEVVFSYTGYREFRATKVSVDNGKASKLDAKIRAGLSMGCGYPSVFQRPLVSLGETTQGMVFEQEALKTLPYRW